MGLTAADFEVKARPGVPCGIAVILDGLTPKDREVLTAQMARPVKQIQHARVAHVLANEGWEVSPLVVGRHRRGQCSCGT